MYAKSGLIPPVESSPPPAEKLYNRPVGGICYNDCLCLFTLTRRFYFNPKRKRADRVLTVNTFIIIVLTSIGGWGGWWLGYHLGIFTALVLSMIGTGFGLYAGRKIGRMYG